MGTKSPKDSLGGGASISPTKPTRITRQYTRRAADRRLALLLGSTAAALVLGVATYRRQQGRATSAAGDAAEVGARAYMVATGIFALPPAGREPGLFAAAQETARRDAAPLAHTIWVDSDSFDQLAWRDLLQVGRVPINRPPAIDFQREVAVLVWPVASLAPPEVARAPGLVLRAAALVQHGVELRFAPAAGGGPLPATPISGGPVTPYALVTVPRDQWPIPVPAPDVPPLAVTLLH